MSTIIYTKNPEELTRMYNKAEERIDYLEREMEAQEIESKIYNRTFIPSRDSIFYPEWDLQWNIRIDLGNFLINLVGFDEARKLVKL